MMPQRDAAGAIVGVVGVSIDVTEQRRAEAALRKNERLSALGTLVAGVAHEINNPLAFMRATADLDREQLAATLARSDLSDEARDAVRQVLDNEAIVLRGIDRIAAITSSLKQVARPATGARAAEDPNALVQSVLTVAAPRVKGGARIRRELAARRRILASASEISQVLLNLVFNALDATGAGDGEIVVRTRDADGGVVFEVEDHGVGIPPEDQAKIFVPFHTTKPNGTGLGLSVSWRIVEDHGGRLTFASRPGEGTTFRLELPAVAAPVADPA
jgi:signal transduction histidine kinase